MRCKLSVVGCLCALVLGISACASHRPTGTHTTQIEHDALVTVEAVDVPSRLVTVRDSSGASFTVYVDESNKAFPQATVGDQVRIRYIESLALRLARSDESGLKVKETTTRPQTGQASGRTSAEVTAIVRIEDVRANGSVVSFTGPRGRRSLSVQDPAMRDYVSKLKPGDHVEATYTEALAVSLEKVTR